LRGLIWNEPWTQVKVTKIGYSASLEGFREAVMDISESTINAYWKLVADREQLAVANKSLETAHALLKQTETQYEVGVVSKVEVVEAEAGVADREFNLIVARNTFENSEDDLVDAVLGRALNPTMTFRLEPADDPEDYEKRDVDVERSIRIAYQNLPDLVRADRAIEQREIEVKFAKNQRLPQFDIDGRYGFVNTSGDQSPNTCSPFQRPPGQTAADCLAGLQSSGYRSSFNDMYSEDGFENYSVRGIFSIPIPNRAARHNVNRSKIELRRAKTQKSRTKQDVILAVRSAARGIIASAQGIEAAERRRLAAEEQLRAERIRLEHGESTPFEVLQRESDLVDAESQKITALQAHRAADARLERAQGTILDTYRIRVDSILNSSYE
jgi:outer membrane protein TolC